MPETSVTIKAKYTGKRELNISVRAIDDTKKEIIVYSGTTKLESFSFDSGAETEEASNLVKAIAASDYITAEASLSTSDKTVAVVASEKLTGGTDPVITTESYSSALNLLEPYNFNYVTLDTTDEDATAILASWVERVMQTGKLVQAVVGCSYEKSLSERLAIAKSFNSMLVICSGIEGENANGEKPKDYIMSALVCGAIAGTPNTESIVHKAIPEITSIAPYTNKPLTTMLFPSGQILCNMKSPSYFSPNNLFPTSNLLSPTHKLPLLYFAYKKHLSHPFPASMEHQGSSPDLHNYMASHNNSLT